MGLKSEMIIFGARKDDFVYFAEHFEARMHFLKLGKVLSDEATHEDQLPTVRTGASEEQRRQAVNKGREEVEERKRTLWYELVQAIVRKRVVFLRPHKIDSTKAWDILCKKFREAAIT